MKTPTTKPHTYEQVFIHLIFAPRGRQTLLSKHIEERIYQFIGQTIVNRGHKPYIINGMPDHIHILLGLNTASSISELVRDIKRTSSTFINENHLISSRFHWQEGYGAFSYGKSQLPKVSRYIINQKEHHMKMRFQDEYKGFLTKFGVVFDEKFLFEFYD